jgi:hypothetical protein
MKYFYKIKSVLIIILVLTFHSCTETNEKHIGEWKGESKGEEGCLIFDQTNHAVFVIGNQVFGGENFVLQDGVKGECKYEIDYSKNPICLDIVFYEQGVTEEKGRLKGIVRFVTDNKIEYRVGFDGNRFDKFNHEDTENTMVLDRLIN